MARADFGSAKYQAKKLKAAGLQQLRFYCQICQKQCRDANGFKNHLGSPSHKGRVENIAISGHNVVEDYSARFLRDFLRLLRIGHGTKKINANKFYQEYILNDKDHVHMNSTKWSSLTSFVRYLGQNGHVRVDTEGSDDEFNLVISLIDAGVDLKQQEESKQEALQEEKLSMRRLQDQIDAGKQQLAKFEQVQAPVQVSQQPVKLQLKKTKRTIKPSAFNDDND